MNKYLVVDSKQGLQEDVEYIHQNSRNKYIIHSNEATEENFYKRAAYEKAKGTHQGQKGTAV